MPITVKEIMRLPEFQNFTLIAGRSGERNQIMNIGILDYEYANEDPELERLWAFRKNAFVISSMLFAKDHPERIFPCIKGLVRDGVAALAFKTIYYDTLPKSIFLDRWIDTATVQEETAKLQKAYGYEEWQDGLTDDLERDIQEVRERISSTETEAIRKLLESQLNEQEETWEDGNK